MGISLFSTDFSTSVEKAASAANEALKATKS